MTPRLNARRRQAAMITAAVTDWARESEQIRSVALVGSYARGQERMASDIDLVILADAPDAVAEAGWFRRLQPGSKLVRSARWGPVQELRFRLKSGLIVELGITSSSWADLPLDAGSARVLSDGHRILFDDGLLAKAVSSLH
jgi:predicted nucleotidyltransferase